MKHLYFYLLATITLFLYLFPIQKVTAQPCIYEVYNAGGALQ